MTVNNNHILKLMSICFFLLTQVSFSQSSQNDQRDAEMKAKQMFDLIEKKDFDGIIDITYPKVFDIASKDQMKSLFKSMISGNEDFSIELPRETPEYKVSKVYKKKGDSLKYAFLTYDMKMKMTFNNQTFDDAQKESVKKMMQIQGMDVAFVSDNTVDVNMRDRITILIKDNYTKGEWSMINYDAESPFFYQLFPSVLIEDAKDYKEKLLLKRKKDEENKN